MKVLAKNFTFFMYKHLIYNFLLEKISWYQSTFRISGAERLVGI